jgi:hypothetical protein
MNQCQDEAEGSPSVVRIVAALDVVRGEVAGVLAQEPAASPDVLLDLARAVDGMVRTGNGLLLQVLARMDEAKAVRGGIGPWLTAQLGYSPGRARGLAQDARRLGALPEVTQQLAGGALPSGAGRVLARAAHAACTTKQDPAAAVAETISTLQQDGIQAAERQVRVLEHTLTPAHGKEQRARQRAASFVRIGECESGMVRFDGLLDKERATLVRTALDLLVSTWLRERQYDHTNPLPDDVHSTEQLTAEALTRLAEVFLNATEEQRAHRYTPTVVYYAPAPSQPMRKSTTQNPDSSPNSSTPPVPAGCVETGYGDFVPAIGLPGPRDPAAVHLTVTSDGQPAAIDGLPVDRDPAARLASPAQRLALAFRDRHCTHPGCTRPASWSLHAHHRKPYAQHGPTVLSNLTMYCPQHHTLAHHSAA